MDEHTPLEQAAWRLANMVVGAYRHVHADMPGNLMIAGFGRTWEEAAEGLARTLTTDPKNVALQALPEELQSVLYRDLAGESTRIYLESAIDSIAMAAAIAPDGSFAPADPFNGYVTQAYGSRTVWASPDAAYEHYYEAVRSCEGAERDRYLEICFALENGFLFATDGSAYRGICWPGEYRQTLGLDEVIALEKKALNGPYTLPRSARTHEEADVQRGRDMDEKEDR